MKTRTISKILVSLGLVFVLGSAITQVRAEEDKVPIITIHSTGDITRGEKPGAFVLNMNPVVYGGMYVTSVSAAQLFQELIMLRLSPQLISDNPATESCWSKPCLTSGYQLSVAHAALWWHWNLAQGMQ